MNRQTMFASLTTKSPDVLIIGGGINGIGVFRDLALQGVNVLLVDRADFCSGASAASSHMAHGGIRYLENGEFRLVREAVHERNRLLVNAPHIVKPLPTTIPIFKLFSGLLNSPLKFFGLRDRPSERGALVIKIGLILYDAFTRGQGTVPLHVFDNRSRSLAKFPRLNPAVISTATYYDGLIFSPERLAMEVLLDGESEGSHARSLNYVSLAGRQGATVTLKDEMTGQVVGVSPRLIINAAGPWVDAVNRILGLSTRYIRGTKGSHLVLDNPELRRAVGNNEFFFENKDGRIVLILPFGDKTIVGTSDLPNDDPDSARCTPEEEGYFMEMIARVFPGIPVRRGEIVYRFCGVRPLAFTNARNPGQITRDHHIQEDRLEDMPIYSLIGGKWTTFRAFAEQVTDRVLATLGSPRRANTMFLPIGGGKDFPIAGAVAGRLSGRNAEPTGPQPSWPITLSHRYGMRAKDVWAFLSAGEDHPLRNMPEMTRREVLFLAENEKIVHLDDLLLRRTMLAYLGRLTRPLVVELADHLGQALGWPQTRAESEVDRFLAILADRHGVRL
jgi:glycerol-3-phosphate dehydrogenase